MKSRIRQSQIKAAVKVNAELLRLYWDLGQDIVARQGHKYRLDLVEEAKQLDAYGGLIDKEFKQRPPSCLP